MLTDKTAEKEKLSNRAKYLSNSITITPKKHVVPTLFARYYSWLTNSLNLYNLTIGTIVKNFCMFGETEINAKINTEKNAYIKAIETIAYGIIKSCTNAESLGLFDYINYQVNALEKVFNAPCDTREEYMVKTYKELFFLQDLDGDGRLGVQDLAVSIAYLDMQDGVLNGKLRYQDAITLGSDIESEVGKFKMKLELSNLKEMLYD